MQQTTHQRWFVPYNMREDKGEPMNKFRITIELDTWSAQPEDWVLEAVSEAVSDELTEDETLTHVKVERVS
tara:strand:+ start:765 stop:977 length:213 start_codon:yes stop_codon:yes gene_type:complete